MEEAHRGHEPDAAPGAALGSEQLAQLGDRAHGPHAGASCAGERRASAAPARRTASTSSGAASSTAARCAATVASSPRATGPVSAASGPSSAMFSTVWRTSGASSARASLAARARRRRRSSPPRPERDEEVRGHRRGGVVGGAALVVDLEGRHAEPLGEPGGEGERLGRRSRHGRARALEAHARVGERSGAGAGRRPRRRRAPARRAAWRRSCGPPAARRPSTTSAAAAISASGTHSRMASQPRRALAAAERALDLDAGVAERARRARYRPGLGRRCPPAAGSLRLV